VDVAGVAPSVFGVLELAVAEGVAAEVGVVEVVIAGGPGAGVSCFTAPYRAASQPRASSGL